MVEYYLQAVAFRRSHQMLSESVSGSRSNLEEAKRRRFPEPERKVTEAPKSSQPPEPEQQSQLPESKHDRPSSTFVGRVPMKNIPYKNKVIGRASVKGARTRDDVPASRDR